MYMLIFIIVFNNLALLASTPPKPAQGPNEFVRTYYHEHEAEIADFTKPLELRPMYRMLAWLQHQDEKGAFAEHWMVTELLETGGHWDLSEAASSAEARIFNSTALGYYLMHPRDSPQPNTMHEALLQAAKKEAKTWGSQCPNARWSWHVRHYLARRMLQYPDMSFGDYLKDPCNLDRAIQTLETRAPQTLENFTRQTPFSLQLNSDAVIAAHKNCTRDSTLVCLPVEVIGKITSFFPMSKPARSFLNEFYGLDEPAAHHCIGPDNPYVHAFVYLGRFMAPLASIMISGKAMCPPLQAIIMRLSRLAGVDRGAAFQSLYAQGFTCLHRLESKNFGAAFSKLCRTTRITAGANPAKGDAVDTPSLWIDYMDFLKRSRPDELKEEKKYRCTEPRCSSFRIAGPNNFDPREWKEFLDKITPLRMQSLAILRPGHPAGVREYAITPFFEVLAPGGVTLGFEAPCPAVIGSGVGLSIIGDNLTTEVKPFHFLNGPNLLNFLYLVRLYAQARHTGRTADWLLSEHSTAVKEAWVAISNLRKYHEMG